MSDRQLLGSRYKFVKTLGSDPQGSTYLVVDTFLDDQPKRVVKKLPLLGKSPKAMRFILVLLKKKAEALKHVGHHDQIPKILAYFEEDNFFYLVEEFIPGRSLNDVLKPGQTLPEPTVRQLIREVLKILLVVHSWGVIHRCIKPSNLIQRYPDNQLVLTGFGIFKEISAQNGKGGPKSVTPRNQNGSSVYIPLDQSQGQRHFSSDIYAVGMIGIQALTGLPPQELQHLRRVGHANQGYIPESLSWHSYANVSPEFRQILDRMICPNPEYRYATAANVLEDLDRLLMLPGAHTPSLKSPATTMEVTQLEGSQGVPRKATRRRIIGVAAALCAIGLAGVLFGRVPQQLFAMNAIRQGSTLQADKQYEAAIAQYTKALTTHPTTDAYTQRGVAYLAMDDLLRARDDLNRAIELDISNTEAFYQRGNVRYQLGDLQGALDDYTQAIQRDPDGQLKAYVNRGTVRAALGDDDGAITDYTEAIRRDPTLAAAYLNRCLSRSNLDQHQPALADCTQAIQLDPDSVLAYQNRGLVRRRLGDVIGAIQDFNIAINLDPDDADPYYNRGLARQELGDMPGAIADYTQAITLDKTHTFAHYDRAIAKMQANEFESAIADLEQSAKLCLDAGRMDCYNDAQYQIKEIQQILGL